MILKILNSYILFFFSGLNYVNNCDITVGEDQVYARFLTNYIQRVGT